MSGMAVDEPSRGDWLRQAAGGRRLIKPTWRAYGIWDMGL
jgi:hypothetical protein